MVGRSVTRPSLAGRSRSKGRDALLSGSMALTVFAVLMVGYGLVAARLERLSIGPALAFLACGLVVGGAGLDWFQFPFESESLIRLAELTLALVLFNDAASMDLRGAGRDAPVIGRLLAIGLPLSIGLGALAALILFPGTPIALALLIGAILAPTDAALASQIVTDVRVPSRVRRILNVESGLNDGIASPFVVLFTVMATTKAGADGWLVGAIVETGTALLGRRALAGGIGAWLLIVSDVTAATSGTYRQVVYGSLALAAFGLSGVLGGNGFIAAFVAGIAFRRIGRGRIADAQHLTEGLAVLMSIVVWLLFGAVIAGGVIATGVQVAAIVYAIVSLTVVRMGPVAVALIGSRLRREPVAFIGWFGSARTGVDRIRTDRGRDPGRGRHPQRPPPSGGHLDGHAVGPAPRADGGPVRGPVRRRHLRGRRDRGCPGLGSKALGDPEPRRRGATPGGLALEPGGRVVLPAHLVEVGAALPGVPADTGAALRAAGADGGCRRRVGRTGPVGLTEHRVQRPDVGLDAGGDDVRTAGLARVFAGPAVPFSGRRRDPDRHRTDRVRPLAERVDVVGQQPWMAAQHGDQRLVHRRVQGIDRSVPLRRGAPVPVAGRQHDRAAALAVAAGRHRPARPGAGRSPRS